MQDKAWWLVKHYITCGMENRFEMISISVSCTCYWPFMICESPEDTLYIKVYFWCVFNKMLLTDNFIIERIRYRHVPYLLILLYFNGKNCDGNDIYNYLQQMRARHLIYWFHISLWKRFDHINFCLFCWCRMYVFIYNAWYTVPQSVVKLIDIKPTFY